MPEYRVALANPHAHLYRVTLTVDAQRWTRADGSLIVSLPVWIPGSYMVREFARHVVSLQARLGRRDLPVRSLDKSSWQIDGLKPKATRSATLLHLQYEVYAYDASVRTAWLDAERGFFNGTSLFLRVHGAEDVPHTVRLGKLPKGWRVATGMSPLNPKDREPSDFVSANYDELVDHPFELGPFWRAHFDVKGVPHSLIVSGAWPGFDGARLVADTKRVCETQMEFWHGPKARAKDLPVDRYVFLLHATEDGYGGLEHRASTALIAARRDLPREGSGKPMGDGYLTLLGLISHEYFHTWNVKRMRPQELATLDYTRENYTRLLWFFEGFTSYYDDLMLRRAGLVDDAQYLKLLAKPINGVLGTPGRTRQSVAQSSLEAWTKYYRQDENSVNAIVSYYTKGSLVALALDLTLRHEGRGSLDDVMQMLWHRSGGGPIDEAAVAAALQDVAGRSMARELKAWVHGTSDGPWLALLQKLGVQVNTEPTPGLAARWGLRVQDTAAGVQIKQVLAGSAAEQAGLAVQDEILAIDGWRVRRLDDALGWCGAERPVSITVVRQQRLRTIVLASTGARRVTAIGRTGASEGLQPAATLSLSAMGKVDAATAKRRQAWMQGGAR